MSDLPAPTGAPVDFGPSGMPLPPPDLAAATEEGWHRLSPRMLLVHPARALGSMVVPLVLVGLGVGRGEDNPWWMWAAIVGGGLALLFGVLTWYSTRYRFTPEQLQLRTGVVSRSMTTAPLDRIRSVDIESSPLHRVLGLAKAKIGTGVDSSQIELDGLTRVQAGELRVYLLRLAAAQTHDVRAEATVPSEGEGVPTQADQAPGGGSEEELARIDWSWLRYAPFSLSSLVVVAGAFGVFAQFGDEIPVAEIDLVENAWAWVVAQAVLLLVAAAAVVVVLGWVLVSTTAYVLNWWNLRLVREPGGKIRTTRGLLTTHSQTIESAKIRGVTMTEQFLLRFVRGAELTALATGVGSAGTARMLPPAPRHVVQSVGHALLEEDGPLTMTLTGHGPRARRRIHVSQQWGSVFLAAVAAVLTIWVDVWWFALLPWWSPLAVLGGFGLLNLLLAESAWRNLGHGLTDRHVIVQTGAIIRSREVLERAGVIGWVIHQSFFQRRLGLADLTATTAAGAERLVVPNVPVRAATELADRATPGMLDGLRT